jgi:hypothetical protein
VERRAEAEEEEEEEEERRNVAVGFGRKRRHTCDRRDTSARAFIFSARSLAGSLADRGPLRSID